MKNEAMSNKVQCVSDEVQLETCFLDFKDKTLSHEKRISKMPNLIRWTQMVLEGSKMFYFLNYL